MRGAPRAFHSCLNANGKLYVAGGMQYHKGKWGTGADFWSTEGKLNGWTKYVEFHSFLRNSKFFLYLKINDTWYLAIKLRALVFFRHPNMPFPKAGFGLVSLKTGFASDVTNILAIGGIQLNRESVMSI